MLDGISGKVGDNHDKVNIPMATEVKVCVMTFQSCLPGIPHTEVVAAMPQSNNESNDFIVDMESASAKAMQLTGVHPTSFINYAVDGVSCESRHVWTTICDFLSCKHNHLGSTDTNHNMKSWRHQIIGGGGDEGGSIGKYMINPSLLQLGGVSDDLIRPKDFASDNLVKALVNFGTIKKMVTAKSDCGSTRDGDKAVLAITLFFMGLQLHSVNGKATPPNHRVVYLWCSMLWLTSICGTSIVTKRNVVSAVIPLIFIFIRPDVQHSRFCTSEPIEHTFGNNRAICREFTVLNFCQLIEKQMRRLKLMYQHKFCPSRDPKKGYQATYADFFEYSMSAGSKRDSDDNVHMFDDSDFIAKELWDTVRKLISHSNNLMTNLFNVVGVLREELSPFCREFKSAEDLRDEFIKFCPVTFKYNDVAGVEQGQIVEQSNMESKMSNQVILQKIGQFANDMENTCSGEDSDMSRSMQKTIIQVMMVMKK